MYIFINFNPKFELRSPFRPNFINFLHILHHQKRKKNLHHLIQLLAASCPNGSWRIKKKWSGQREGRLQLTPNAKQHLPVSGTQERWRV